MPNQPLTEMDLDYLDGRCRQQAEELPREDMLTWYREDVRDLVAEVRRLRQAFAAYGAHYGTCSFWKGEPHALCDCGLNKARGVKP